MSFKNNDLKGLQIEFNEVLAPQFSVSEIRLIWRESLRHFFGITPSDLMLSQDRIFSPDESILLFKLVNRLNGGEPFQYLIGEIEFYGLPLKVDQRALIPRPETEELVDWIVNGHHLELSNILDICSGSGCISLALSHHFQKANVLGVEYSKEALELSEENSMKTFRFLTNICYVHIICMFCTLRGPCSKIRRISRFLSCRCSAR